MTVKVESEGIWKVRQKRKIPQPKVIKQNAKYLSNSMLLLLNILIRPITLIILV